MLVSEKFVDNYAAALMDLAVETKRLDHYLEVSNMIVELFKRSPDYIKLMMNADLLKEERKKILAKPFQKAVDPLILNALFLLIDREAFCYVRRIFKRLRKIINISYDVQYGNIFSTQPLTKKQIETIENKLSKKFGYHIELVNKIDPSLLGGVRVKIKHEIIDGSIAGQLETMRQKAIHNK
ncbi:F0F1 ATP synthase subunit delta [Spiroplasma sp. NBRC 100390]|uniref:F0F1 ATP synthase subunit delta n=1 Tax=unclassified Spiroplasma TaxID=2637901 RepID=UPI0008929E5F|nr:MULTISPECIES: F0F1 ATP synthase subunit delta [unclassified Spiroplasma]AOX43427.1 F0F1 ATP synthase subunit delta [Spiroplasma sp. TU-14]APE12897.1 F0F1 ATP synthase subunit delta [Spiroplasma sp. NBRC 100390]